MCEKCTRTILGLELAGMDPNEHGYKVNANTFTMIKNSIEACKMYNRSGDMFLWEDIKRYAGSAQEFTHSEVKDLFDWLVTVDIGAFREEPEVKSFFESCRWLYRLYVPYPIYRISRTVAKKLIFRLLTRF